MAPNHIDESEPRRFTCPICGQVLTFHNSRIDRGSGGHTNLILVYFCIKHGFFRSSDDTPQLTPGM